VEIVDRSEFTGCSRGIGSADPGSMFAFVGYLFAMMTTRLADGMRAVANHFGPGWTARGLVLAPVGTIRESFRRYAGARAVGAFWFFCHSSASSQLLTTAVLRRCGGSCRWSVRSAISFFVAYIISRYQL